METISICFHYLLFFLEGYSLIKHSSYIIYPYYFYLGNSFRVFLLMSSLAMFLSWFGFLAARHVGS